MRKRTFYQRPKSRNLRLNLGCDRYKASWHYCDYGKRRRYRHTSWPNDGSRLWHFAWDVLCRGDRRRTLFETDPSALYQSPTGEVRYTQGGVEEQP